MFRWIVTRIFLFVFFFNQIQTSVSSCLETVTPDKLLSVYQGWPHALSCKIFLYTNPHNLLTADQSQKSQCIITSSEGAVLWNETTSVSDLLRLKISEYVTPDNISEEQTRYTLKFENRAANFCLSTSIRLNVTTLPQVSCQEYVPSVKPRIFERMVGTTLKLLCNSGAVALREYPKINIGTKVEYKWQHNCLGTFPPKNIIHIKNLNQSGTYVCSATYNGMTRYLKERKFCVTEPSNLDPASLSCSSTKVKSHTGEKATFDCKGNFGFGRLRQRSFKFQWAKIRNGKIENITECSARPNKKTKSCVFVNPTSRCQALSKNFERNRATIVDLQLSFNPVQSEDYGIYLLMVSRNNLLPRNLTLILEPNNVEGLISQASVAGICIGIMLLLLIMLVVLLYNSLYVRVYYKKYFGAVVPDDKIYGATLAYKFSSVIDNFEKENLQVSVPFMRDILEDMGYSVYDPDRNGWVKLEQSENLRHSLENSHRFFIFLTLSFIKDGWSMLSLYKGLDTMIQSGSKLVFVLFPGMKEYLKQHSNEDVTCAIVQRAVKLNYSIEWKPQMVAANKKRLRFHLTDAMPKLRTQTSTRIFSTTTYLDERNSSFRSQHSKSSGNSRKTSTNDNNTNTRL